jgi:DNA mismatch repair protein MSH6
VATATPAAAAGKKTPTSALSKSAFTRPQRPAALTPQPSSDAAGPPEQSSPVPKAEEQSEGRNKENGVLPSPGSSEDANANRGVSEVAGVAFSSPSRKVRLSPSFVTDCTGG